MSSLTESHLRCRLGFHKWTRYKVGDTVTGAAEGPAGFREAVRALDLGVELGYEGSRRNQDGWETRCRYCQKRRRLFKA